MMNRRTFAAGLVSATVLLGACGVPLDDEPSIIATEDLPQPLQPGTSSTTTTLPDQLTEEIRIFLVARNDGEAQLVQVIRQVPVVDAGSDIAPIVLEQLFEGPTSEEQLEANLTSSIVPSGDTPIEVVQLDRPADNQLVVVLSEAPNIEGSDRTVAFAQLVFTLTELSTVDQVRFAVRDENGEDADLSVSTDTEEGDVRRAVDRRDFPSFRAGTEGPAGE